MLFPKITTIGALTKLHDIPNISHSGAWFEKFPVSESEKEFLKTASIMMERQRERQFHISAFTEKPGTCPSVQQLF